MSNELTHTHTQFIAWVRRQRLQNFFLMEMMAEKSLKRDQLLFDKMLNKKFKKIPCHVKFESNQN